MKRTIAKRLAGAMFAVAALCFGSCSSSSTASDDIFSLASKNDLAVVRANAKTIIENAGGAVTADGVDFPAELMNGMSKETRTVLTARGIDLQFLVANVTEGNEIGITFHITDQKAFDEYLTEVFPNVSVNEEKGYTFRKVGDETYVFTNSGIGYMLQAEDNGVDRLEKLMQQAKANPVAEWQKTAVEEGNALGLIYNVGQMMKLVKEKKSIDLSTNKLFAMQYDPEEFASSYVKVNASLDGAKLTANSEVVNAQGNTLKSKLNAKDVDASLLKYANADDMMIFMMSMPTGIDWNEMTAAIMEMVAAQTGRNANLEAASAPIAAVLENVDGSVMVGFGMKGTSTPADFDGVVAVQLKDGVADEYLKQLHAMASGFGSQLNLTATMADNTLTVKGFGFSAYAKAEGNTLVISLHPITGEGGCTIPASLFNGKTSVFALDLPKDSSAAGLVNLPFGISANAYNQGNGGAMNAELTGVTGGFIENILRVATSR